MRYGMVYAWARVDGIHRMMGIYLLNEPDLVNEGYLLNEAHLVIESHLADGGGGVSQQLRHIFLG